MKKGDIGEVVEVIFENGVLRPIVPIRALQEHQKAIAYIYPSVGFLNEESLVANLSPEDADQLQQIIDHEFERIEGDW